MKHWITWLGMTIGLIFLLAIVYLSGPRLPVDTQIAPPATLPDDLDGYLAEQEARFSDIRPGTEKTIVWADSVRKQKTPLSIVYVHGFSATRQDFVPVIDQVAAHYEANLYYERLTGHGRTGDAMAESSVNAWLNDVARTVQIGQQIGDRTVFVGSSAGGSLLTWLAAHGHLPDDSMLVLVAPAYGVQGAGAELMLAPWGYTCRNWFMARIAVGSRVTRSNGNIRRGTIRPRLCSKLLR